MRNTVWLGLIFVTASAAIAACNSSEGTGGTTEGTSDTGTGGNMASSSSSTSSSGTGGSASSSSGTSTSSSTSSSTSASSSGTPLFNGCDPATAEDHLTDTDVPIAFGGVNPGLAYSPKCIKIKAGSTVTFNGSFSSHPLAGGSNGTMDASSPIQHTVTGSTATFTFPTAGDFGFYCEFHFLSGMEGAVFVQ